MLEKTVSRSRTIVPETHLVRDIMEEVKEAYLDLKRAEINIRHYRKAVEYHGESSVINQVQHEARTATYTEVLDSNGLLQRLNGFILERWQTRSSTGRSGSGGCGSSDEAAKSP